MSLQVSNIVQVLALEIEQRHKSDQHIKIIVPLFLYQFFFHEMNAHWNTTDQVDEHTLQGP